MHTTTDAGCGPGESTIVSETIGGLAAIFESHVNVAVLRRPLVPAVQMFGAHVAGQSGDLVLATIQADATGIEAVKERLPDHPGRQGLLDDVAFAAELLCDLTGAGRIGLRLASLSAPMCPRFHVDRVLLRLLTTYTGPATEWLDGAHADRSRLAAAIVGDTDPVPRPGAVIRRCDPFDVVLLKGEAWPGNEGRGAVHRSPPVTAGAAPRLLMTLDVLD